MTDSFIVLKSKVVASVTKIDENYINVCFEGKVLNQYGTFDYLHSSNTIKSSSSSIYLDLHCDLLKLERLY